MPSSLLVRSFVAVSFFSVCLAAAAAPPAAGGDRGERGQGRFGEAMPLRTAGLEKRPGLLDTYFDRKTGKVWLLLPPAGQNGDKTGVVESYIYSEGILTGVGSNPVGLDRGQLGDTRMVTLRRVGGRLLVEEPNLRFRALSQDAAELAAVRESFATSVLWAGEVVATEPKGHEAVDFTSFLVRDAHNVTARLKQAGQGSWSLDPGRSAVDFANSQAFPENLEFEAVLTYQSQEPGELIRQTAPAAEAVTLVQHQSFLRLPDGGYHPRAFDPRAGSFPVEFLNYAAPLSEPIETKWIARHRLEKIDPQAARSKVRNPIVYYIDPGAPEPVRSALMEGVSWWKEAFDQAGFIDAFRVELLPPGASPMDARYNMVQWVHRSTRGWSYGGGITDPRTGEMLQGHVTLGSLRIRQDRLIFEGLAGADKTGSGAPDDPIQISLARIRQLAAHEVGHSLGLSHNFAASTYGRASVMDYPAPQVDITPQGDLDFSHAYAKGLGAWDIFAIKWAYTEFPPGTNEKAALDAMLRDAIAHGLIFLTDQDARPPGAANPKAVLWDNGSDPVESLRHEMDVRRIGLARFGEHNIAPGQPLALLQEVLVPLYLHHRYQLDAALKMVGGLDYSYALRGDGQPPARPVDGDRQRAALAAVLDTMTPAALDLPDPVIALLLPRPAEYRPNLEMFHSQTNPAFDPLGAAAAAADLAVDGLLQPERAGRLVDFHRRDAKLPGLEEVLAALVDRSFGAPAQETARQAELRRVVQWVVVRRLIGLADNRDASSGVRARVEGTLRALRGRLAPGASGASTAADPDAEQHAFLASEITHALEHTDRDPSKHPLPPPIPPGQPIGEAPLFLSEGLSGCSWGD
ncbi:MAG TPA: zinc-dependent metalloprotease [Thermoanaerobaculia bacterium]|nr:zinc-dependent metalloprotease [Thermoanaerobaculia bacterium]